MYLWEGVRVRCSQEVKPANRALGLFLIRGMETEAGWLAVSPWDVPTMSHYNKGLPQYQRYWYHVLGLPRFQGQESDEFLFSLKGFVIPTEN